MAASGLATLDRPAVIEASLPAGGAMSTLSDEPAVELAVAPPTLADGTPDLLVRVFLNRPEADGRTPISDAGYVGSITLFAASEFGGEQRVRLPIGPRAAALLSDTGVTVTVVPVPIRPGAAGAGGSIAVISAAIIP
jgi:hypothetical protein